MAEHAEVFISATTRDLGSYRRAVKDALLTKGIFPIEETNFELAYGPLTEMLQALIGRCDAVIHSPGFYHGEEPPLRPIGQPRRSYTQMEYDVARNLGKPIYLFFASENCEFDQHPAQSREDQELQANHRRAIEQTGDVRYLFTTHQDLESLVHQLQFTVRPSDLQGRVIQLPFDSLGPLFKGRDVELAELRQRLRGGSGTAVGLTVRQTIHGLGGVGKTRLAIELAWRHAGDYTALFFISVRSSGDLRSGLAGLGAPEVLNLPEYSRPEEGVRVAAVLRWLVGNSGWLLILDNVDTVEAAQEVKKTLPQLRGGQVIITSRLADWGGAINLFELDVLSQEDAVAFVLQRTEARRRKKPTDIDDAAALAQDLGGLALALEQTGAYIGISRLSFSEYRTRWDLRRAEVLAWYNELLMDYPSSVAVTWQTTVDQLSMAERKLLDLLAWLGPEVIPVFLLDGGTVEGKNARDALAGLALWSLTRWAADGDGFTVHRLVQEISRQRLPDNEKDDALSAALDLLNARLPSPDWDEQGWQLWEQLAPHCRTLLDHLSGTS